MSNVARQALAYFIQMGWSAAQSAGIVASLIAESNLNPTASGDGGQAYGIAQWHPPRQAGFEALIGKPIQGSSLEDQLAWVHAELMGTEKAAGDALARCTTASEAGACVSQHYERPADQVGEATKRARLADSLYQQYGTTQPQVPPVVAAQPRTSMDPVTLITVFGPLIAQLIPQVSKFFGGAKDKANLDIASKIIDTVVAATGQPNVMAAVDAMSKDKALVDTVTQTLVTTPGIMELLEVGGGVAKAREANLAMMQVPGSLWHNPVLVVTMFVLPLVYLVVIAVMFGPALSAELKFSEQIVTVVVTAIVTGVVGAIMGFWMGQTFQQSRSGVATRATDQGPK